MSPTVWIYILVLTLFAAVLIGGLLLYPSRNDKETAAGSSADPPGADEPQVRAESVEIQAVFQAHEREIAAKRPRGNLGDLPRFMVLGNDKAGRASLLRSLGLEPHESHFATARGLTWWLYDRGIVFEPDASSLSGSGRGWQTAMKLLASRQPERPLDGIILAIPIDDLLQEPGAEGPQAQSNQRDRALRDASIYSDRLKEAQLILGFRLPIYIVLTGCDRLAEFRSFTDAVPANSRQDIFGWSNPYTLETSHTADRTAEMFAKMVARLREIQLERFASGQTIAKADAFFQLPERLKELRESMEIYIDTLFRESIYHEPYFFRGMYLTGDGDGTPGNAAFSERLFYDKIFTEHNLARPVRNSLLSRNRRVRLLQVATLVFTLVASVGLYWSANRAMAAMAELKPSVLELQADLRKFDQLNHNRSLSDARLGNLASNVFENLRKMPQVSLRYLFIPYSWPGGLDSRLQRVLEYSYRKLVLRSIRNQLLRQSVNISDCFHLDIQEDFCQGLPRPELTPVAALTALPSMESPADEAAGDSLDAQKENQQGVTKAEAAEEDIADPIANAEENAAISKSMESARTKPAEPPSGVLREVRTPADDRLEQLEEFGRLLRYLETIGQFEENVTRYNRLMRAEVADVQSLVELAYYLNLPVDVKGLELSGIYLEALQKIDEPGQELTAEIFIFRMSDLDRAVEEHNRANPERVEISKDLRRKLILANRTAFRRGEAFWQYTRIDPDKLSPNLDHLIRSQFQRDFAEEAMAESRQLLNEVYEKHFRKGIYQSFDDLQTELIRAGRSTVGSPAGLRFRLQQTLHRADRDLQHLNQAWIGSDPFQVDLRFQNALRRLELSSRGQEIALMIRSEHSEFADEARKKFAGYDSYLTGPIFARQSSTYGETSTEVLQPLQYGECMNVFREVLLDDGPGRTELLLPFVSTGRALWNPAVLTEALNDYQTSAAALPVSLERCPASSLPLLQIFGEADLRSELFAKVNEAIFFEPVPVDSRGLLSENSLKAEAESLKAAQAQIQQLQAVLEQSGNRSGDTFLYAFLSNQGARAMRSLQEIVSAEDPYGASPEDYLRWDGRSGLTFQIYGLHGEADIEKYLTIQRKRLGVLGAYARPYVDLLESSRRRFGNSQLVKNGALGDFNYWKQITAELKQYEVNKARTSIDELERFILFQMDTINANNCCSALDCRNLYRAPAADFFRSRLFRLKVNIKNRCQSLYLN